MSDVGGLVGQNNAQATITNVASTGQVGGTTDVGGLVGANLNETTTKMGTTYTASITGTTTGFYASGMATGTGTNSSAVGGLVGENQGSITDINYDGASITGSADVGGAVRLNDAGATLLQSFVRGYATGTSYAGAVVGGNFGSGSYVEFTPINRPRQAWSRA